MTSESSRAGIARAVVCLSWLLKYLHCRQNRCGNQTNASIPQDRRGGARHCRRWLRLTLGDVLPVVPLAAAAGVSSARFFRGAGAFLTQVHGGTRGCASLFCLPSFSMLRQGLQKGSSDAPDAFAAAALAALIDAARGVLRDNGIRYSTWTWYHHHTRSRRARATRSGLPGACAFTSDGSHLVITRKEIRCTRCNPKNKETISLSIQPETRYGDLDT